MNNCCFVGRLTRDPELRTTNTGKSVVNFSIAVNKRFKTQDGPTADFLNCVAWGQTADYISTYANKGRLISVISELQTRKYTDKDGNQRESVEFNVSSASLLDKAPEGDQQQKVKPAQTPQQSNQDEYDPFADS